MGNTPLVNKQWFINPGLTLIEKCLRLVLVLVFVLTINLHQTNGTCLGTTYSTSSKMVMFNLHVEWKFPKIGVPPYHPF